MPSESKKIFCTSYCNKGHHVASGRPVEHECLVIPPAALAAEMAGDFKTAIMLLQHAPRVIVQGRTKRSKKSHRKGGDSGDQLAMTAHQHAWTRAPELDDVLLRYWCAGCGRYGYAVFSRLLGRRIVPHSTGRSARLRRQLESEGAVRFQDRGTDPNVDRRDEEVLTLPPKWSNVDE